jgi:hypothetical protein
VFEKAGVTNRAELAYLAAQGMADRQGKTSIVPPRCRLPEDGLRGFASKVEQASARLHGSAKPAELPPSSRIVYTPPLTLATA